MSAYTKINFNDIEDQGSEGNEMRYSRKYLDSRDLGMTRRTYKPNYHSDDAHSHKTQEEVYVVIRGSGRILLDDKVEDLKQWDVVRVAPQTVRAFESGPEGLELLIAGGPKPPEGDGVRAKAAWPN